MNVVELVNHIIRSYLADNLIPSCECFFFLRLRCSVSVVSTAKRHKAAERSPSNEDKCHPLFLREVCRVGMCSQDKHWVIKTPDCKNYALLKAV